MYEIPMNRGIKRIHSDHSQRVRCRPSSLKKFNSFFRVAASDLEESLRALFLAALAHDLLTPLLFCFRDNLFHWFITLEYRALSLKTHVIVHASRPGIQYLKGSYMSTISS